MLRLRDNNCLQFVHRFFQDPAGAEYADLCGHDILHLGHQRSGVFGTAAIDQSIDLRLLAAERFLNQTGGNIRGVFGSLAKIGDKLTDDHARHDGLGHRVSTQPVKAMHVPAGRFAGRE